VKQVTTVDALDEEVRIVIGVYILLRAYECCDFENYKVLLGLSMQNQRKFSLAKCHSHSNAHKPPQTLLPPYLRLSCGPPSRVTDSSQTMHPTIAFFHMSSIVMVKELTLKTENLVL